MAPLNITLNQEEFQALLLDNRGEEFWKILIDQPQQDPPNRIHKTVKAAPYEWSEELLDSRNGSRKYKTERSSTHR